MSDETEVKESRRDLLSKAWDEAERGDKVEREPTAEKAKEDSPEKPKIRWSGDEATEVKAEKDEKPAKDAKKEAKESIESKPETDDQKEAKAASELEQRQQRTETPAVTDRAPNSWKPAVREHWAKLPPEVRAEVSRREREIQQTLSQTAQVRKFAGDFAQIVNPFSHLIRAQNSTPLQAVHNLMSTAAGLMQGNAHQKAAIVAEIIQNYGVDIPALDKILSGNPNVGQPGRPAVEPVPTWAKPVFDFMGNMQRMQEQAQQRMAQEADEAIQAMQDKPFFDDLRDDIADIMETAANRGRKMTIDQAYNVAVQMNPEIKKIVEQRTAATRNPVSEAAATLAKARRAASTIAGAPSTAKPSANNGKMTRRQMLSEAWDDASS